MKPSPEDLMRGARFAELLTSALALREASLVIFRRGALIEFKTDGLSAGVSRYEEQGHVTYQVGDAEGHHCHLDLFCLDHVLFGAEPVECQGGRLNYTVWFMATADSGNPHRPLAAFSVTLNAPYDADGTPRRAARRPGLRPLRPTPWGRRGAGGARVSGRARDVLRMRPL